MLDRMLPGLCAFPVQISASDRSGSRAALVAPFRQRLHRPAHHASLVVPARLPGAVDKTIPNRQFGEGWS